MEKNFTVKIVERDGNIVSQSFDSHSDLEDFIGVYFNYFVNFVSLDCKKLYEISSGLILWHLKKFDSFNYCSPLMKVSFFSAFEYDNYSLEDETLDTRIRVGCHVYITFYDFSKRRCLDVPSKKKEK